jgi:uncharacterized protein (DUF3084 family)
MKNPKSACSQRQPKRSRFLSFENEPSKKAYSALKSLFEASQQELADVKEQTKALQRKNRCLKKEKERAEFELKKMNYTNEQLKKKINIQDNSEEIQHIINELCALLLNSTKKANIDNKQLEMVKLIFGDFAKEAYERKIRIAEIQKFNSSLQLVIDEYQNG